MNVSLFDYVLPKSLIAQHPASPRGGSRLLVLNRKSKKIEDTNFASLTTFLKKGDVLVFNNSRVIPARLHGKKETGGSVEVFLLFEKNKNTWEVLLKGKNLSVGQIVLFKNGVYCKIVKNNNGVAQVVFSISSKQLLNFIEHVGETPLPPYIKEKTPASSYQTIYADPKKSGSVAAPTAGLHFTKSLLTKLKRQGIQIEFVTLYVGLGTFAPVKVKNIKDHTMHPEFVDVQKKTIQNILSAKKQGRRIIAVGTTTVRTLESIIPKGKHSAIKRVQKWINPFFYPGYSFHVVDTLITNFHLPKSTLIMLVSAFAGRQRVFAAYKHAIRLKYRFYSFGDAMLII